MYNLSEPKRATKYTPPPGFQLRCSTWFCGGGPGGERIVGFDPGLQGYILFGFRVWKNIGGSLRGVWVRGAWIRLEFRNQGFRSQGFRSQGFRKKRIPKVGETHTGTIPETEISKAKDSEVRDSEDRDSESGHSEDRGSESRDSEAGDSENGQIQGPLNSDTFRLPLRITEHLGRLTIGPTSYREAPSAGPWKQPKKTAEKGAEWAPRSGPL